MQTLRDNYLTAYRNLKLTRDAEGVLVVQFHSNGGPLTFTAEAHTEVVDAFYRISQDRANKIVILTGAGGDFMIGVDWSSFTNVSDPGVWSQIHDEGVQVLENIANIRVPVIAAIEGRAHIHSEYALLANVVVAAEGATFPYAWYFRHLDAGYVDLTAQRLSSPADVLILTEASRARLAAALGGYHGRRFPFRGWWVRDYGAMSVRGWWEWFLHRRPWNPTGGMPEWLYIRNGVS